MKKNKPLKFQDLVYDANGQLINVSDPVRMLLTGGRTDTSVDASFAKDEAVRRKTEEKRQRLGNFAESGLTAAGTIVGTIVAPGIGTQIGAQLGSRFGSAANKAINRDFGFGDYAELVTGSLGSAMINSNKDETNGLNLGNLSPKAIPGGMDAFQGATDTPSFTDISSLDTSMVAMYGGNIFKNVRLRSNGGFLDFEGDTHGDPSLGINMTKDGMQTQTFVEAGEFGWTDPNDGSTFIFTNSRTVPKELYKSLMGKTPKKEPTWAEFARMIAKDAMDEPNNPLIKTNTQEMMRNIKDLHQQYVPESRDPEMAGLNNQTQGAAFAKYGGDLQNLGRAAASVNLLFAGGQNPPTDPPSQNNSATVSPQLLTWMNQRNPNLVQTAMQYSSQPQQTVDQKGITYNDQMPEEYRSEVFKAEGGLSDSSSDPAAADIKGIKDAKYHTNMGLRYKTYKELAQRVLGVQPNYNHFVNLTQDDLKKFQDHYWRASGASMVKDPRLGFIMFHNMWGGTSWNKMAKYINDRYDVSLKTQDDIIEFMNQQENDLAIKTLGDHLYDWRLNEYLPSTKSWTGNKKGWTTRETRMRNSFDDSFDKEKIQAQENEAIRNDPNTPKSIPGTENEPQPRQDAPPFGEQPKDSRPQIDIDSEQKRKNIADAEMDAFLDDVLLKEQRRREEAYGDNIQREREQNNPSVGNIVPRLTNPRLDENQINSAQILPGVGNAIIAGENMNLRDRDIQSMMPQDGSFQYDQDKFIDEDGNLWLYTPEGNWIGYGKDKNGEAIILPNRLSKEEGIKKWEKNGSTVQNSNARDIARKYDLENNTIQRDGYTWYKGSGGQWMTRDASGKLIFKNQSEWDAEDADKKAQSDAEATAAAAKAKADQQKADEQAKAAAEREAKFEKHRKQAQALRNTSLVMSGTQAMSALNTPRTSQAITARNITNPDVAERLDIDPIRSEIDRQVRTGLRNINENVVNPALLVAGTQGAISSGARAMSDMAMKKQQFDADEFNRWAQSEFQKNAFNRQMENTIFNQNAADEAARIAMIRDSFSEFANNLGVKGLEDLQLLMTERFPYNAFGQYNPENAGMFVQGFNQNPQVRSRQGQTTDQTTTKNS